MASVCFVGRIMLGGEVFSQCFIMCTQTNYTESSIDSEQSARPPCLSWSACDPRHAQHVCVCMCVFCMARSETKFFYPGWQSAQMKSHGWSASARPGAASRWVSEMKTRNTPFLLNWLGLNVIATSLLVLLWFSPPMISFALELPVIQIASKQGMLAWSVYGLRNTSRFCNNSYSYVYLSCFYTFNIKT